MEHSFNIEIAKEYGINSAILLNNIYFWIEKNRANNINFYDGNYWTFNSRKAFAELFPYMNERQIDYALKKLIDDGVIITGNYNKMAYDRTLWYAITKKGYSILQNCEMELTKLSNGTDNIVEPIPYNKPDNKQDIKHKYGEYQNVSLTDAQIEKLNKDYGEDKVKRAISYLDSYIQEKNYKTKDHNLTLRRWVFKALDERKTGKAFQSRDYSNSNLNELFDNIQDIKT